MTGEDAMEYRITNIGTAACRLLGYPGVSLYAHNQQLPFVFTRDHSPYVTHRPPQWVLLMPGRSAYFRVAKFRCDVGETAVADTIRVFPPGETRAMWGPADRPGSGAATFGYCKNEPSSNRVSLSPVEPTVDASINP